MDVDLVEQEHLKQWNGQHVVYLLKSTRGPRTYTGYSNNVAKRIKKHNGLLKGGARYTSIDRYRPWRVKCIVFGFATGIEATKFEWAWKNCHRSKTFKKMLNTTMVRKAVGIDAKISMAQTIVDTGKLWFGQKLGIAKL